jgi:hypothetical protein
VISPSRGRGKVGKVEEKDAVEGKRAAAAEEEEREGSTTRGALVEVEVGAVDFGSSGGSVVYMERKVSSRRKARKKDEEDTHLYAFAQLPSFLRPSQSRHHHRCQRTTPSPFPTQSSRPLPPPFPSTARRACRERGKRRPSGAGGGRCVG